MNRPEKANAINAQMWRGIAEKIDEGTASTGSRVIAITGTGEFFSAGEDIKELDNASDFASALDLFVGTIRPVFDRILKSAKPVVAAVNGRAIGAGVELVLACDMAVANPDASFALAQGKSGIGPALALTVGMPTLGRKRLAELAMTGRRFSAEEAQRWGVINSLATEGLVTEVERLAEEVSQTPPTLIRLIKEVLLKQFSIVGYESAFDYIAMYSQSQESRKGIDKFLSRRS